MAKTSELEDMEGKLESAVLAMDTMLNRVRTAKAELLQPIDTEPKKMSLTGTVIFKGIVLLISQQTGLLEFSVGLQIRTFLKTGLFQDQNNAPIVSILSCFVILPM